MRWPEPAPAVRPDPVARPAGPSVALAVLVAAGAVLWLGGGEHRAGVVLLVDPPARRLVVEQAGAPEPVVVRVPPGTRPMLATRLLAADAPPPAPADGAAPIALEAVRPGDVASVHGTRRDGDLVASGVTIGLRAAPAR